MWPSAVPVLVFISLLNVHYLKSVSCEVKNDEVLKIYVDFFRPLQSCETNLVTWTKSKFTEKVKYDLIKVLHPYSTVLRLLNINSSLSGSGHFPKYQYCALHVIIQDIAAISPTQKIKPIEVDYFVKNTAFTETYFVFFLQIVKTRARFNTFVTDAPYNYFLAKISDDALIPKEINILAGPCPESIKCLYNYNQVANQMTSYQDIYLYLRKFRTDWFGNYLLVRPFPDKFLQKETLSLIDKTHIVSYSNPELPKPVGTIPFIKLALILAKKFNFTFEIGVPRNICPQCLIHSRSGIKNQRGKLVKHLYYKVYNNVKVIIIYSRPVHIPTSFASLMEPFSPTVWTVICATIVIIIAILKTSGLNLNDVIFLQISSLIFAQVGVTNQSYKIFFTYSILCFTILINIYVGTLKSFTVSPEVHKGGLSYKDLVSMDYTFKMSNRYEAFRLRGLEGMVNGSKIKRIHEELMNRTTVVNGSPTKAFLHKIRKARQATLVRADMDFVKLFLSRSLVKSFFMAPDEFFRNSVGWRFIGADADCLDQAFSNIISTGIMARWFQVFKDVEDDEEEDQLEEKLEELAKDDGTLGVDMAPSSEDESENVTMDDSLTKAAFNSIVFGICIGVGMFILEMLVHFRKKIFAAAYNPVKSHLLVDKDAVSNVKTNVEPIFYYR
ncbi:unnamed protein product [Allacma fusca]|uniref:Uncharacterized protein n=1 Tax=Allacma fusca TaxID=39272 RepID=A0A8J2JJP2_9HEXA|nr:unnamed protein product [Allacma fusca]